MCVYLFSTHILCFKDMFLTSFLYLFFPQYCVVKFKEDDDICYEGAPVIWIETFVNDNLVKIWWPPNATKVSSWAGNQKFPDSSWTLCEGEIVKYCGKCHDLISICIILYPN